jgi:hypothetical protein
MLWPRTAPGEDLRCQRFLDRPHRGDPGGVHADHECCSLVLQRREPFGESDRIGWTDATAYCSRIGMRLPTESEWEWAVYGGTAELPKEPVGSLAWYEPNSNDTTHPVASKVPNGYGLWDMLGNVCESVQDSGKEPGEHILKGGSFYNSARDVRVSGRLSALPDLRHRGIGFRCASSTWPEERPAGFFTTGLPRCGHSPGTQPNRA